MILYYAIGGGLGHLCRTRAVINTLHLQVKEIVILTASPYASAVFKEEKIVNIPANYQDKTSALRGFINELIQIHHITKIYLDTFPAGIVGEFNMPFTDKIEIIYIARLLNWNNYSKLIHEQLFNFQRTYVIEPLTSKHNQFIEKFSEISMELELVYPEGSINSKNLNLLATFKNPPWIIVHSGPFDELRLIYQHATETAQIEGKNPEFLIISQIDEKIDDQNAIQIKHFPASVFFPYAEKIFTACGFNIMYETRRYADKHYFIPFKRKFDDQFARALLRKNK